ncbi:sulfite exporter TauE/SafE family protein [Agilicoccus flavus]|uniref:sulfite exporter TauE/SafE family protein n=1 Tax=Agilicoccus flavus TaxID=2775968 RepID=UPI001CF63979|nr:sulfite exporter TauE/SafE family protein [Agilicoccus flavus]
MPLFEIAAILLAGVAAGTINTIVGSGSLITFPVLLFFGYPPVVANMSNTVGLIPGGLSGVHGYRRELAGHGRLLRLLVPASFVGGAVGAGLLLVLPETVFGAVVPVLIAIGLLLVVAAPAVQRRARARQAAQNGADGSGVTGGPTGTGRSPRGTVLLVTLVFLTGIYGGYFGAAQGVILLGVMSMLLAESLQVVNGVKNVLGLVANTMGAAVFVVAAGAQIDWWAALLIGLGTLVGGVIGAGVGRRLPPVWLRGLIVVVGVVAIAHMTVFA